MVLFILQFRLLFWIVHTILLGWLYVKSFYACCVVVVVVIVVNVLTILPLVFSWWPPVVDYNSTAGTMPVSGTTGTAIPLRATRSTDSRHRDWNSHLPVPSPPAGCQHIGESENAGRTLAGERTSTYIFKYSWSKTTIKRQLQTNWSKLHSLQCIALHCIGGRRNWATTGIFNISIVRQHCAVS